MKTALIRRFQDKDAAATAQLFYDAVHHGTQGHYSHSQRNAWAPLVPKTARWRKRLASQITFVAERQGQLAGFMSMTSEGHIDLAFTAPDQVRKGIATSLYNALEAKAKALGMDKLDTYASHLAQEFFANKGWLVVRAQEVTLRGVTMRNFLMEKRLAQPPEILGTRA